MPYSFTVPGPRVARCFFTESFRMGLLGSVLSAGELCSCARPPREIGTVAAPLVSQEPRLFAAPITDPPEDGSLDAIVRVVGPVSCTGTLIADDLVLTAHRCLSKRDASGRVTNDDVDAQSLRVELGQDDFPFAEVRVRAFVAPRCEQGAENDDIAILILSRKLTGLPTWAPRLVSASHLGDTVGTAGFGECLAGGGIRLHERPSGRVVGPGRVSTESRADESRLTCPGDEGGPVFEVGNQLARELVGVVSSTQRESGSEMGGAYDYTPVDAWRSLFNAAQAIAKGAPAHPLNSDSCR
jgi:hypothetical protein